MIYCLMYCLNMHFAQNTYFTPSTLIFSVNIKRYSKNNRITSSEIIDTNFRANKIIYNILYRDSLLNRLDARKNY